MECLNIFAAFQSTDLKSNTWIKKKTFYDIKRYYFWYHKVIIDIKNVILSLKLEKNSDFRTVLVSNNNFWYQIIEVLISMYMFA